MDKYLLEEMTWEEAEERLKKIDIAILPVGSIEQHGPHLPLSTDAFDAYWLAKEVVKRVPDPKPIVLPPINYGVSYHHMAFCGTISISPNTLMETVYDIGISCASHGIRKLLIINGHGGNTPAIKCAGQKLRYDKDLVVFIDSGEAITEKRKEIVETEGDMHAGEYETSTSLANRENLVRSEKIKREAPTTPSFWNSIPYIWRTDEITKSGIIGDATKATKEKGKLLWKAHIKNLVIFVEELKKAENSK